MKLLIAEDDRTSRLILRSVCTKWGYDVVAAEDGQAAWQLMQGNDVPQLMIIDWEMPRMNGIELCQLIRKKFPNNPPYIILLTSRNETKDIVVGLKEGANDYIAKPFNNDELQVRMPQTKILLLAIFPREHSPFNDMRKRNGRINQLISVFADQEKVFYFNINQEFLNDEKKLSEDVMPDLLHPNNKGYQIWAKSMQSQVMKLLN